VRRELSRHDLHRGESLVRERRIVALNEMGFVAVDTRDVSSCKFLTIREPS
jgi:hypothetical protein